MAGGEDLHGPTVRKTVRGGRPYRPAMRLLHPLALVLLLLVLASCGGEDADGDAAAPDGAGGGEVVEIALTDFALDPAALELEPGTYTFRAVNEGENVHALKVDGPGGEAETGELAPGESAELTVELAEGETELTCPVGDHRERGMEGTVSVGGGGAGTTTDGTTTDGTTTDEDRQDDGGYDY